MAAAHPLDPSRRNGIDTRELFRTVDTVRHSPHDSQFTFRAQNEWVHGTQSRSTIAGFAGLDGEQERESTAVFDADHPVVLAGRDIAPTPGEFVLHAIAACLAAGVATIAAARGITLTELSSTVTGQLDVRGAFGLDAAVRPGFEQLQIRLTVKGDAPPDQLAAIVEQARRRSVVYDVIAHGVPLDLAVDVGAVDSSPSRDQR